MRATSAPAARQTAFTRTSVASMMNAGTRHAVISTDVIEQEMRSAEKQDGERTQIIAYPPPHSQCSLSARNSSSVRVLFFWALSVMSLHHQNGAGGMFDKAIRRAADEAVVQR